MAAVSSAVCVCVCVCVFWESRGQEGGGGRREVARVENGSPLRRLLL